MFNQSAKAHNAIKSSLVGLGAQLVFLGLSLVSKTLFIKGLGTGYLGINGLFTNIFLVLSFAEHGIGPVMSYYLYEPIATNKTQEVALLYSFFNGLYKKMTLLVGFVGGLIIFVLPWIINLEEPLDHVLVAYLIFLGYTALQNRYQYRTHLLLADQRRYRVVYFQMMVDTGAIILQMLSLVMLKSYLVFLVIALVKVVVFNGLIANEVKRLYPFLIKALPKKALEGDWQAHYQKIQSVVVYRMARVLITGTDNVIISIMVGTLWVGYYSNYDLLVVGVLSLVTVFYQAVAAAVGHTIATESPRGQQEAYRVVQDLGMIITAFTTACLLALVQSFIVIWLGPDLLLSRGVVYVIVLNYYLVCNRNGVKTFRNASGLFEKTRNVMIIAAGLNIILSLVMGYLWGLLGVLLATSLATVSTYYWYEGFVVMDVLFDGKKSVFLGKELKSILLTLSTCGWVMWLSANMPGDTLLSFILKALLVGGVAALWPLLVMHRSQGLNLGYRAIKTFLNRSQANES